MVANFDRGSALLVSELTGLVANEAMKSAGRENPNRWTIASSNQAPSAGAQNRSCSIKWAVKQEKRPAVADVFFLDFSFYRTYQNLTSVHLETQHQIYRAGSWPHSVAWPVLALVHGEPGHVAVARNKANHLVRLVD